MNKRAICYFVKKISASKNFKELAEIINEYSIKIYKASACWTFMLNISTNQIEINKQKISLTCPKPLNSEVKMIRQTVLDLFENFEIEDITEFINSTSENNKILYPITYKNSFAGYFGIITDDEKFYKKNIESIKILSEFINARFEIIALTEEKKRTLKERTEFLASVAHEFKTPLNAIIGFSDILTEKTEDETDKRFLYNISQSSIYLMKLIQSILDYSRSEYKPFELKIEKFRPKIIIENILEGFEEIRKEKNITFNYTLSDIIIKADLIRLKQVIYNLISNALKFSKEKSVISIVTYINNKNEFVFEIQDKGDGISKKDMSTIFNFFTQVNRSQMKRQQGSGIGLALCRKILQAHGGEIYAKSKLHGGSTFWFSIPIEPN